MKKLTALLILPILTLAVTSCSFINSRHVKCPSVQQDYNFWSQRTGFARQAQNEKWTLAETRVAAAGSVTGTPPFYYLTDSGRGYCLCPAR